MVYISLLGAGVLISVVHAYLVWKNYDGTRYSISEHAISDRRSYFLYLGSHIVADILFVLYAYTFFYESQSQTILFLLTLTFIALDFVQALLPSRDKSEPIHFISAYMSWAIYQLVGVLSLFILTIAQPYLYLSVAFLVPVLVMFTYMHFKRDKLWPFQLLMVPMYILSLLFITLGSS